MKVNCYHIDEALQLASFAPEDAVEACQRTDARIWIDVQTAAPDELEEWLDTFY